LPDVRIVLKIINICRLEPHVKSVSLPLQKGTVVKLHIIVACCADDLL